MTLVTGISKVDLLGVGPLLAIGLGGLILLLVDVFNSRKWARALFAAGILLLAMVLNSKIVPLVAGGKTIFNGLWFMDPFTLGFSALIILAAFLALLLSWQYEESEGIEAPGEYYSLFLMTTAGALVFIASAELITFFVGLEIMSMGAYAMCGSALGRRQSSESALKYFLLGSFSSAFMLYGIALFYGLTGSTSVAAVTLLPQANPAILFLATGLIIFGLIFKIGLVPFHFWVPDVYQGAPTPVTAFMASVIKIAAVGGALRIIWTVFGAEIGLWQGAVWLVAVLSMVVANLIALRQRSLKRMLAYSSIGHAGYMLMGILSPGAVASGGSAIFFYLIAYTLMTIGAFAVVQIASTGNEAIDSDDITNLNGFADRQPVLAAVMTLFMLSLAGLPPGMAGMLGKFYIFNAAIHAQFVGLAIVGVLCSAVSCYYYLRVVVAMYFVPSENPTTVGQVSLGIKACLLICAVGILLLGLFPASIYDGSSWIFLK